MVFCITGATYAYFTAVASNNSISGNAANIELKLDVKKVTSADNETGLIPMSNNMIEMAVSNSKICIDDNGNAVCQVYKVTVNNTSKSSIFVDGYVTLTGGIGEPADYTEYKTNNKNTMRWAQVFCNNEDEDGNVTSCTTAGNSTVRTGEPIRLAGLGGEDKKTDGLNKGEIKDNGNDVLRLVTISNDTYNIIGSNYIRVSDHSISSNTYSQDSDITSALVYNQSLLSNDDSVENDTGTSNDEYTDSQVYYFMVWLSENGQVQTPTKSENFFGGVVTFTSSMGNKITARFGNSRNSTGEQYNASTVSIENLFNDGNEIKKVRIGDIDKNPEVELNETQKIMKDNYGNYRYYGADPHNWVSYNGEKWRIISYSKIYSNESDQTGSMRIKLIKPISIGKYSYDSSEETVNDGNGINDWSRSDLMYELNNYYLNSTIGTCYNGKGNASIPCDFSETGLKSDGRDLIDDALYYLGGYNTSAIYVHDFYGYERGSIVYDCSKSNGDNYCPRPMTWKGKVGIMYPSDYAYAADLSICKETTNNYDNTNCKDNNWLYLDVYAWTITPRNDYSGDVFSTNRVGSIYNGLGSTALIARSILPVVYLKPNIQIIADENSDGTEEKPYKLSVSS